MWQQKDSLASGAASLECMRFMHPYLCYVMSALAFLRVFVMSALALFPGSATSDNAKWLLSSTYAVAK